MQRLAEPLLVNFPAIHTHDVDEVRAWIRPMFAIRELDMPNRGRQFECVVNHCRLRSFSLVYSHYGSPFIARMEQNDCFLQGFPLTGAGEVCGRRSVRTVRPDVGGVAAGPGSEITLRYDENFSHLILKVSPTALTHRLSLLLGRPIDPPLQLTGRVDPERAVAQLRLLRFLAEEVDRTDNRLSDLALAELEDVVLVNCLVASEHNYSGMLSGASRPLAPWQVRRAMEYMEQHWDQAVTIEKLTQVTGTSARSLFLMFRKTYGVSPMVYLSGVRLRHAREMLSRPDPQTSVTQVGFECGFSNLGRFSTKYFSVFGEKPSDTLKFNR